MTDEFASQLREWKELEAAVPRLIAEVESVVAENAELRNALERLYAYQNGPPLPSYEQGWTAAMA